MKIRRATDYHRRAVEQAAQLLSDALICARAAGCPKLCGKIRRALASAGGARRHMRTRLRVSRPALGVLHPMRADRTAFQHVESPERPAWFRSGQYA